MADRLRFPHLDTTERRGALEVGEEAIEHGVADEERLAHAGVIVLGGADQDCVRSAGVEGVDYKA